MRAHDRCAIRQGYLKKLADAEPWETIEQARARYAMERLVDWMDDLKWEHYDKLKGFAP